MVLCSAPFAVFSLLRPEDFLEEETRGLAGLWLVRVLQRCGEKVQG
jgi:hypothetical protein